MPRHDVLAIILGGGRGTRLFPLTKMRAKPAVPLAAKYRLIDIPISNCINSEINRIFVLTQFLSASLHRHVYETYKFDVFYDGFVELLPAEQTLTSAAWYQGTADAVRRQMHRVLRINPRDSLILSGDHLYRMDYTEFLDFHRSNEADITIAVYPVPIEDTHRFGILTIDPTHRVTRYLEKPRNPDDLTDMAANPDSGKPFLASMGVFLFRTDRLRNVLETVSGEDFGRDIIPNAIRSHRVCAFPFRGYWEDIGSMASFFNANLSLTDIDPPFDFYDPNSPIYTRSRFLPPSRMDGCRLSRVVIADGCRIASAAIERSIIGNRSIIRSGADLTEVVMLGADHYEDASERDRNEKAGVPHIGIGEDSVIERAIIDKNVRIGQGVRITRHEQDSDCDRDRYSIRDGITVIPKNAVIPDGTVI